MLKPNSRSPWILAISGLLIAGCFSETTKPKAKEKEAATEVSGELFKVAGERGLNDDQIRAAMQTYVPTGARDTYVGLMGAGTSGRLVIFGMPSMRILKYAGVFTPEPWQGFAYDDESRNMLRASAREDIEYSFGDSAAPALSEKDGNYDGVAAFLADGANGRVAVLHLDDYETKQIVTNPVFRSGYGGITVTPNTEFVVQNTSSPDLPIGEWAELDDPKLASKLRGGVTFWPFDRGHHTENRINESGAFTVELPPYVQGESDAGKGASAGLIFTLGFCSGTGVVPGVDTTCGDEKTPAVLHIVDIAKAQTLAKSSTTLHGKHPRVKLADAAADGALRQVELPAGPTTIAVSADGATAIITHDFGDSVSVLDLNRLKGDWSAAKPDAFGVPTLSAAAAGLTQIKVGGPTADVAFGAKGNVYISVITPGKLVRIDLAKKTIAGELALDFPGGKLMIPQADTASPTAEYAVVMNTQPRNRLTSVGPVLAMNPHLIDISGESMRSLSDMAVPQATRIDAVAIKADLIDGGTVVRYPPGTNTRTGELSDFRTAAGEERVERKGNRVHVFGTLIRSHITPEIVEVTEGDVVTFHLTNLEQAQDQTHGFTVSTYNVHSSWEPGKVASVTFTVDKAGVYPYYCTEFCSALHLEMMGYLMVKPKNYVETAEVEEVATPEEIAQAKLDYEAKAQTIKETQAVIDSVVAWLNEHEYKKDVRAVELVTDAVAQLNAAAAIQPQIDAAIAAGDWPKAKLWAEQYFQYQVKAADAGVRAKNVMVEGGAK